MSGLRPLPQSKTGNRPAADLPCSVKKVLSGKLLSVMPRRADSLLIQHNRKDATTFLLDAAQAHQGGKSSRLTVFAYKTFMCRII